MLASARMEELGLQLGCRASALQFAASYCGMLTGRITRITDAVHLNDSEAAMDAVLSLKIASNMVGAEAMEHCCLLLQAQLKAGDSDAAGTTTTALEDERGPLLAALADLCARHTGMGPERTCREP